MIHTLEMPYNQGLYVQWKDLLKSTGLPYNTIVENTTVTNVLPSGKDAGEMGFTKVNEKLKETKKTAFEDVVFQKLKGL